MADEHRAMRHALYGALHALNLWTPDRGIEIPEELSARLDIPLDSARALQPLFPPAAAGGGESAEPQEEQGGGTADAVPVAEVDKGLETP